ncbi:MAG TPA: hypothetical protein DD414_02645 [Lachnospiraceae bacterium]|nr:hypothetical protein [Lachnospiraceae bacterium]
MEQLIKITSVPMQMVRYTQNARLVSSDSVALERKKALARQMSFHRSAGRNSVPVQDITKINRAFSKHTAPSEGQTVSRKQAAFHQVQPQPSAPQANPNPSAAVDAANMTAVAADNIDTVYAATAPAQINPRGISAETRSTYSAERGAFEMKVAKGDLTYLPPMVMTIITQRPELHFEYLGDFNYVPPREPQRGGAINLFT